MRQANRNTTTSDRLTTVLSYGALLLLGYVVFLIVQPFLIPLAWSAVLTIFFYPVFQHLERRTSPTWAALICTLGVTLLLIVPVLLILLHAAREAIDASARIRESINSGVPLMPMEMASSLRRHLPQSWQGLDVIGPLRQGEEKIASYLAASLGSLLKNLFSFFVDLFILLFALFFVFRDGEKILRSLRHLIPFEAEIQEEMLRESRDLIFASVAVALLIAAIQAFLGGTAFKLSGLPAPIFMGVVIGFCSIIPVVGSALIWVPAAAWLGLSGHWGKALLVLAICGGVASVADSFVRPLLLRNRTRLNDLLLFISILGGLDVFGLLGLVIGPTMVAAALGVFRVYVDHREELARLEKEPA
ncbi:MAG TPA: AI-2E family transporter [Candidatus Limnocylindrales bacterium]|nr:AI-2E family transporter [Candidatus Limnocylindrales bacterium]